MLRLPWVRSLALALALLIVPSAGRADPVAASDDAAAAPAGRSYDQLDDRRLLKEYRTAHRTQSRRYRAGAAALKAWTDARAALDAAVEGNLVVAYSSFVALNQTLARLPAEATEGYRLPEGLTVAVTDHYRLNNGGVTSPRTGERLPAQYDAFRPLYIGSSPDGDLRVAASKALAAIDTRLRAQVAGRVESTTLDAMEAELNRRFTRRAGASRAALNRFLADASPEEVAVRAEATRLELQHMLAPGEIRREPVLRGHARSTERTDATREVSTSATRIGITLQPLGVDLGFDKSGDRSSFHQRRDAEASIEGDALLIGADDYDIPVRAPVTVALDGDAVARLGTAAELLDSPDALTRFEARLVLEKALVLEELVEHLQVVGGGRHLSPALRSWTFSRLRFRGPGAGRPELVDWGTVELRAARTGAAALEARVARYGHSVIGTRPARRTASARRDAFLDTLAGGKPAAATRRVAKPKRVVRAPAGRAGRARR